VEFVQLAHGTDTVIVTVTKPRVAAVEEETAVEAEEAPAAAPAAE
jgi:hypothetical protein